uniref:uncharacterized protein C5orf49-like isoform X1 n=1 Tax=Jaculus jaculus TaxID=51337 RepID=UPI001E1B4573|nr:uncharacterized protein C5orf49-like isoform X1 [Jaculus jaculus]
MDGGDARDKEEEEEEEITAATLRVKPRPLPISAMSTLGYAPSDRPEPKELSYYNRQRRLNSAPALQILLVGSTGQKERSPQSFQTTCFRTVGAEPCLEQAVDTMGALWVRGGHQHLHFSSDSPKQGVISLYDCVFKRRLDYDQKLHRDDREHAKGLGLHINKEEKERPVGVLASSAYGKRIHQPVEPLNRGCGRVNHVQADFYRKNDIPSIKEPGFGHIAPA